LHNKGANTVQVNEVSGQIVDVAVKVHSALGPGVLESVYEVVLAYELRKRGLDVQRQLPIPIVYDDARFEEGFRLDLLVEDQVVVEIKSVEDVRPVHKKQLLTYLRLADRRLGLLLNFNVNLMKEGITRIVDRLPEE
jgi:GxxExxY protein